MSISFSSSTVDDKLPFVRFESKTGYAFMVFSENPLDSLVAKIVCSNVIRLMANNISMRGVIQKGRQ